MPFKVAHDLRQFVADAKRFLDENRDCPFFLHFANIETHTPWFVPRRFEGKSPIGAHGEAVQRMDWYYGQIVEGEELRLDKNTLIVFSSGNGPLAAESPSVPELKRAFGPYGDPRLSSVHFVARLQRDKLLGRRPARTGDL